MKLLIILTLCLGFVACNPKDRLIFIVPGESESESAPMPAVHQIPRSFRTYLGSYSHQVGPSTYQNKGRNLAGNSNYGWKYDDYSGGWYQTGIVNPRK